MTPYQRGQEYVTRCNDPRAFQSFIKINGYDKISVPELQQMYFNKAHSHATFTKEQLAEHWELFSANEWAKDRNTLLYGFYIWYCQGI